MAVQERKTGRSALHILFRPIKLQPMSDIRICKSCAQPINSGHITALGANSSIRNIFYCTICQQPITETHFYVYQERPCHQVCYENSIAPHCTLCNKALMGKYQINDWDERYCTDHAEELASCSYCGRLILTASKRTRRRSLENMNCDICAATADSKRAPGQVINAGAELAGLRHKAFTFGKKHSGLKCLMVPIFYRVKEVGAIHWSYHQHPLYAP